VLDHSPREDLAVAEDEEFGVRVSLFRPAHHGTELVFSAPYQFVMEAHRLNAIDHQDDARKRADIADVKPLGTPPAYLAVASR
jgi:hypothetical protein